MPIRVRCPNPECNRLLNVPDKLAGKGCRCPGCKAEIRVPAPAAPEEEIVEAIVDTEISERPQRVLPPAAPPRRRRKEREDDDEDDEVLERSPLLKNPANSLNCILFGVGVFLLLGLAVVPWLPWVSISSDVKLKGDSHTETLTVSGMGRAAVNGGGGGTLEGAARPDGLFFLILAILLALAVGVGAVLALTGVLGKRGGWQVASVLALSGEAVGILFLCWALAWVWKVLTLSELMRKWAETTVRIGQGGGGQITSSSFPGLGLFIGMGLAVGAAYVFSTLSGRLVRRGMAYVADLTGLVLGGLVLLVLVRPWNAQALFEGVHQFLPF